MGLETKKKSVMGTNTVDLAKDNKKFRNIISDADETSPEDISEVKKNNNFYQLGKINDKNNYNKEIDNPPRSLYLTQNNDHSELFKIIDSHVKDVLGHTVDRMEKSAMKSLMLKDKVIDELEKKNLKLEEEKKVIEEKNVQKTLLCKESAKKIKELEEACHDLVNKVKIQEENLEKKTMENDLLISKREKLKDKFYSAFALELKHVSGGKKTHSEQKEVGENINNDEEKLLMSSPHRETREDFVNKITLSMISATEYNNLCDNSGDKSVDELKPKDEKEVQRTNMKNDKLFILDHNEIVNKTKHIKRECSDVEPIIQGKFSNITFSRVTNQEPVSILGSDKPPLSIVPQNIEPDKSKKQQFQKLSVTKIPTNRSKSVIEEIGLKIPDSIQKSLSIRRSTETKVSPKKSSGNPVILNSVVANGNISVSKVRSPLKAVSSLGSKANSSISDRSLIIPSVSKLLNNSNITLVEEKPTSTNSRDSQSSMKSKTSTNVESSKSKRKSLGSKDSINSTNVKELQGSRYSKENNDSECLNDNVIDKDFKDTKTLKDTDDVKRSRESNNLKDSDVEVVSNDSEVVNNKDKVINNVVENDDSIGVSDADMGKYHDLVNKINSLCRSLRDKTPDD